MTRLPAHIHTHIRTRRTPPGYTNKISHDDYDEDEAHQRLRSDTASYAPVIPGEVGIRNTVKKKCDLCVVHRERNNGVGYQFVFMGQSRNKELASWPTHSLYL